MALSSSKSSSNRLWRNISACWYKRRSRVSCCFFAASIGGRQIINSKCCGGDTAYRLFWKNGLRVLIVLYIYKKKKTSGIQKLQRTNNCKESPQWHKGQTSQSRIPKALLQLGMQALIGVRCDGNLSPTGETILSKQWSGQIVNMICLMITGRYCNSSNKNEPPAWVSNPMRSAFFGANLQTYKKNKGLPLPLLAMMILAKVPSISKQSTSNKNNTKHPDHCLTILPPETRRIDTKSQSPGTGIFCHKIVVFTSDLCSLACWHGDVPWKVCRETNILDIYKRHDGICIMHLKMQENQNIHDDRIKT